MRRLRILVVTASLAVALPALALTPSTASAGQAQSEAQSEAQSQARAGSGRCTVVGTARADVLRGTARRDVICGLGGNDRIVGFGGDDVLLGGPGHDVLLGGAGRDDVLGGAGDDEIDGGPQPDDVDGGPGDNVCEVDAVDEATRCRYDRTAPVAQAPTFSAEAVDVTDGGVDVVVTVRVTDDTGVDGVSVRPSAATPWFPTGWGELTSGTRRDGVWTATLSFPQWAPPATYRPVIGASDRIGRSSRTPFDEVGVAVSNAEPDTELPEVSLLAPLPTRVFDVRDGGATVPIRVRMTDAGSGVDPDQVSFIIWEPRANGSLTRGWAGGLRLISGDRRDGVWESRAHLPQDGISGTYNIGVYTSDLARRGSRSDVVYWAEGEFVHQYDDELRTHRVIPDGLGGVQVVGRARTDSTAPAVSAVEVSPSTVDTLPGPARVNLTARAVDTGRGVAGVAITLVPVDDGVEPIWAHASLDLTEGTIRDGTWTGSIRLPQGYPPGRYYLRVFTWDRDQNEAAYVSSSMAEWWQTGLDTDPIVTVVDAEQD